MFGGRGDIARVCAVPETAGIDQCHCPRGRGTTTTRLWSMVKVSPKGGDIWFKSKPFSSDTSWLTPNALNANLDYPITRTSELRNPNILIPNNQLYDRPLFL